MDIHCAVCEEPWNWYGVQNGDMKFLDKERFLKGEGCPSCGFDHPELSQEDKQYKAALMSMRAEMME